MNRRTTFAAAIISAAAAAMVTAGIFWTTHGGDSIDKSGEAMNVMPASQSTTANVAASGSTAFAEIGVPFATDEQTAQSTELIRPAVDWSAIFTIAVPSLVTIMADRGAGAGFFVSDDGHVITNLHVVSGAGALVVTTHDGNQRNARLIAKDAGNDLALLKIDPDGIDIALPTYAPLDELQVGQPVAALGAPFGLRNSLTVGIISGIGRERYSGNATSEPLRDMIQTDASINPGNSGGMLVDAQGRVVGMPTQIQTWGETWNGIGFAVSASAIRKALPTLLSGKDYERSFLGVSIDQSQDRLSVIAVGCGFAADRSGLRNGDVILQMNGQSTQTFDELLDVLSTIVPGDKFTIVVRRGTRTMTLKGTTSSWPRTSPDYDCG